MTPGPEQGLERDSVDEHLRATPPAEALAWVTQVLGGARVVATEPLTGGSSLAMHVVTVDGGPAIERCVLRRYVRARLIEEEPDIAEREARTLTLVDRLPLPTPDLLAVDATAAHADVPALLTTFLPGTAAWHHRDASAWVRASAEAAAIVHEIEVPTAVSVQPFDRYAQRSYAPPDWVRDVKVWERAIEIFHGPVPTEPDCFIHRDFHPGNILWHNGVLTGLVDWQSASRGWPSVDIGHFRTNLLFDTPALVDEFTDAWQRVSGSTFDPWGDVVTMIGMLDGLRDRPPRAAVMPAFEATLARAVHAREGT